MSEYIITGEQLKTAVEAISEELRKPITEVFVSGVKLPEIVRCRDCEHYEEEYLGSCRRRYFAVEPDGFCAWGERK